MKLTDRRRQLMAAQKKASPQTRFVEGAVTQGASVGSVAANGDLTLTTLAWGADDKPLFFPLEDAITIHNGDSVMLNNTQISYPGGSAFFDLVAKTSKGNITVLSNQNYLYYVKSKCSYTASDDYDLYAIGFYPRGGSQPSFTIHCEISVNGEVVVP